MAEETGDICTIKLQLAVDSLIVVLSSKDGLQRQAARRSLVTIGDPAIPALTAALRDKNANVRWEAAKALGEMRVSEAAPALVEALEDGEFGVRWLAAEGLISLRKAGLPPLLDALLRKQDSAWLREGAHHVLRVLSSDHGLHDLLAPVVHSLDSPMAADSLVPNATALLKTLEQEQQRNQEEP